MPIFPWFGVVLAGIAAARLWLQLGLERLAVWQKIKVPRALLLVGRNTLVIYLLHQPLSSGSSTSRHGYIPPIS